MSAVPAKRAIFIDALGKRTFVLHLLIRCLVSSLCLVKLISTAKLQEINLGFLKCVHLNTLIRSPLLNAGHPEWHQNNFSAFHRTQPSVSR